MKRYVYTNEAYRNLEPATGGAFDVLPPNIEGYEWTLHSWVPSPASGVLLILWEGEVLEQDELDPDLPIPYEPTTPAPPPSHDVVLEVWSADGKTQLETMTVDSCCAKLAQEDLLKKYGRHATYKVRTEDKGQEFDLTRDPDDCDGESSGVCSGCGDCDDDEPECDCPGCEYGTGCVSKDAARRIRSALGLGRKPEDLITADDTQAFVDSLRKDGKGTDR